MKTNLIILLLLFAVGLNAQTPFARYEDPVPGEVEQMYKRGLTYLAAQQQTDGSWEDTYGSQVGVAGLVVLAFLAHGEDAADGPYSMLIKTGIAHIINQQQESGYIGSSMYNHGFATLALAEAYGMVENDELGPALDKAVKLLLSSQANNPLGAWRYSSSSTSADTTVSGACLVALLAARNAGVEIPEKAIVKALDFYRICQNADGGFGYTSPGGSNEPRAAIGVLVHALARKRKSETYKSALKYLENTRPGGVQSYHYYYLYYASQAFFHADSSAHRIWQAWNKENIVQLGTTQNTDGSWVGEHGAVFSTASALLSLALNYRLLPIYER